MTDADADRPTDGTAALDKALDVLDAVGASSGGLSQAELSARLQLPRTTMYRLLGTLVNRGLLRRDPKRRVYGLGTRCFEYARKAYAMPDLMAAAGLELRALRDMTGETTYLSVLDGHEIVSLDRCDGAHNQRSRSDPGQRKPLHATSQGKAILSALQPTQQEALVKALPLQAVTARTITDRRRLQTELRLTANRGWSIDDEEMVPGVRCCGAPIVDAQGQVRGAISVAGPAFRLSLERLELLGPEVKEAARRIGAQLSSTHTTMPEGRVRLVSGEWAFRGVSPVWSSRNACLWWADALAPALHEATGDADRVRGRGHDPILAVLASPAGPVFFSDGQWQLLKGDGGGLPYRPLPPVSLVSATVGPDGLVWACVADGERWRVCPLTPGGPAASEWTLNEPVTALCWDASGRQLVLAAAGSGCLYVAVPGQSALRRLATVPKGSGSLSGLAIDADGGVWSALCGGWSVVRFEPDGSVDQVVALPVPAPTALAFGGADGRSLFVTTARESVSREALDAAPLSGRLLLIDIDRSGVVARELQATQ